MISTIKSSAQILNLVIIVLGDKNFDSRIKSKNKPIKYNN